MKEIKTVNELMAHLEELKHNLTGAKPSVDVTVEQKKAKAAYNRAFWEHMYLLIRTLFTPSMCKLKTIF